MHFLLITIPTERGLINQNCSRTSEKIKWLVITLLAMNMKSNHFSLSALLNNVYNFVLVHECISFVISQNHLTRPLLIN